jgi:hypothetical protein
MSKASLESVLSAVERLKDLRAGRVAKVEAIDSEIGAAESALKTDIDAVRSVLDQAEALLDARPAPATGERRKRGERLNEVLALVGQQLPQREIARRLKMSLGNVQNAIGRLRKKGLLPASSPPPAVPAPPPLPPKPAPPVASAPTAQRQAVVAVATKGPPPLEGDGPLTVDQLRPVLLGRMRTLANTSVLTGTRQGHQHVAKVNRDGNGYTLSAGKDGHVHKVKAWTVEPGRDGHRHDLTTEAA